jgi:histidine triad (HIT) family protein
MATLFSKIASGEISSYKVAETADYFAFLDINPVQPGHVLVIPKQEQDYIFDIDDEHFAGLTLFAKEVARALKAAVPCRKVGVAVIGLEVPHAHIHLVPMSKEGDLDFSKKQTLPAQEMEAIAKAIAKEYDAL